MAAAKKRPDPSKFDFSGRKAKAKTKPVKRRIALNEQAAAAIVAEVNTMGAQLRAFIGAMDTRAERATAALELIAHSVIVERRQKLVATHETCSECGGAAELCRFSRVACCPDCKHGWTQPDGATPAHSGELGALWECEGCGRRWTVLEGGTACPASCATGKRVRCVAPFQVFAGPPLAPVPELSTDVCQCMHERGSHENGRCLAPFPGGCGCTVFTPAQPT